MLARLWTNLLSELVQGAKDEFTPQGQAALALSIRPLFEALGTVVPGELDKAARSGQIGRLAGAGGTEFLNRTVHHQDAKPQPEDTMTQTGVINGGATCYQNVTIRQVQSSPAARNAIFSNPIAEEGEEEGEEAERVRNDLHRIIYKMLECIQQENFEDSKKLLVKMWQVFKDEKSAFAPDWRQQDAEEFLTQVFLKHFEGELKSAWGHITETQVCDLTVTADREDADMIPVHVLELQDAFGQNQRIQRGLFAAHPNLRLDKHDGGSQQLFHQAGVADKGLWIVWRQQRLQRPDALGDNRRQRAGDYISDQALRKRWPQAGYRSEDPTMAGCCSGSGLLVLCQVHPGACWPLDRLRALFLVRTRQSGSA